MRVQVLGSAEVVRDGVPVDLGGRKQRMLLAALALYGGRPVAVDTLVDLLWGDDVPASAVPTLHVYLAGVRRALEPDRPARAPAKLLVTVAPGYALRLPHGAVDAVEFDATVEEVHRRLAGWSAGPAGLGRPDLSTAELEQVGGRLGDVLGSWRGAPYVDLADAPAAVAERTRLEELRLVALEDRALVRLALGEHATTAAELEFLVAEYPLRERLWTLLVLALAASGRQADALEALRKVRRILAEELGLDPGAALRELEGAVLRQDPALVWRPAAVAAAPGATPAAPATVAEGPPATADPRRWPLVGRDSELAALRELLVRADTATPGFAVLVGEPGIGKTRLTEELAADASERGFAVLTGHCSEDEGAPPMWPWVGVLRALVGAVPSDALPGSARTDLAACADALSPGSAAHATPAGGDDPARTPGEVDAARFQLWNGVAAVLSAASAVRPLLVILDDLHWADPSSVRLLRHLAEVLHTGRILVVGTRRPYPEPVGALAQVAETLSRRHALRLDLVGLSAPEAARLVEATTSRTPTPDEAAALCDRTEGNPFFLVELGRLLAGRHRPDTGAPAALPAAVTDVVAQRLARLPDATGQVLRTAAVIGRRFDLTLLAAASGRAEDDVLDDLDPALAAGVIAEEETVDRFRFAHALVRDVVYAGFPAARRARRHAVVAAALEAAPGQDGGERLSETARHWLAAGPAHAGRAWRVAAAAAGQARGMYAHEEAAALLAAAVEAQRADRTASALDRYELLMARVDACRWLGDREGLDAALAAAVVEADRLGDVVRLARAAVGTAEGALCQTRLYGQTDRHMIDVLRRVLRELPAEDSELRCRALLVLALELYYADASEYRDALVEQGMAMARRLGDLWLLVWACQTAFVASWRAATADSRRRLADEAVEAAAMLGDPMWEAVARALRAIVAGEQGRYTDLRDEVRQAREIAEKLRLTYLLVVLGELEVPWLAMRGRFAEAERLIAVRDEIGVRHTAPNYRAAGAGLYLYLRLWQGRLAEMIPVMREMSAISPSLMDPVVPWMLVRDGQLDQARREYDRVGIPVAGDDWISVQKRCQAAEIAFALGMPDVAAEAYRWLSPYAGRCCTAGFGLAVGPVDAFLALAASATGEQALAGRHADEALRLCAQWEIPLVARWLRDQRERAGF